MSQYPNIYWVRNKENKTIAVFVHGLTGNIKKTWEKLNKILIEDQDMANIDMILWGYPTKIAGRLPNIWQCADQLQTELRVRLKEYKKIIFIGHSLGGLVIRAMVVSALQKGRIEDCNRIKHIFSLATPNDGLQASNILSKLNKQINGLDIAGKTVTILRNEWINRVYNPDIKPGEERYKFKITLTPVAGLEDKLVPLDSVKSFFLKPPPEIVPGDHITIKDPASADDTIVLLLKNKFIELTNEDEKSPDKETNISNSKKEILSYQNHVTKSSKHKKEDYQKFPEEVFKRISEEFNLKDPSLLEIKNVIDGMIIKIKDAFEDTIIVHIDFNGRITRQKKTT